MQMLELIPTSAANSEALSVASTTSAAATTTTTTVKSETPSSANQTTATAQSKNSKSNITDITSSLTDNTNVSNGAENSNGPLPAFEQAFGSTEIGRYSHEGFFNNSQQNESQQSTSNQVSINNTPDYNSYYMSPTQIPAFESTMHYHQNQLSAVNQYSGFCNYYNYNYNEFHQHFSYSHNQFSHLNPWTSAPIKYENVLNY